MKKALLGTLAVWVVAGVALAAADFWEEKDFTTWSEEDIVKMLEDSPWSQEVGVRTGKLTNQFGKGGESGGDSSFRIQQRTQQATTGSNDYGQGPGALRSGIIGNNRSSELPDAMPLNISWRSALPFKQAVVRRAMAQDGLDGDNPVPAEQQDFLEQGENYYVVSISGFPARSGAWFRKDALMASTQLLRKNKRPLFPENIEVFLYEGTLGMLIYFAKDDPITLADKDVEFVSTVVDIEIKKKFKLKDMVFGGQLVL